MQNQTDMGFDVDNTSGQENRHIGLTLDWP